MLKIEHTEVFGWEAALRGMRNPLNSWARSDSAWDDVYDENGNSVGVEFYIGENDKRLMMQLAKAGTEHAKFLRMIDVTCDVTAMQPWWSEWDTYNYTVRNSCSKMHKIHAKEFTPDDFTCEGIAAVDYAKEAFLQLLPTLEQLRQDFNRTKNKRYWRALIELLPEGYNLRATIHMNYAGLANMYRQRRNHKLTEWHTFCDWIESLPYSELITGGVQG